VARCPTCCLLGSPAAVAFRSGALFYEVPRRGTLVSAKISRGKALVNFHVIELPRRRLRRKRILGRDGLRAVPFFSLIIGQMISRTAQTPSLPEINEDHPRGAHANCSGQCWTGYGRVRSPSCRKWFRKLAKLHGGGAGIFRDPSNVFLSFLELGINLCSSWRSAAASFQHLG